MKHTVLSAAAALMLGGCASAPMTPNGIYSGLEQSSPVRPFPTYLNGGQPYMTTQPSANVQHCSVTATDFEPPPAGAANTAIPQSGDQPVKLIAAACWI